RIRAIEPIEDSRQMLGGNSGAAVLYRHLRLAIPVRDRDFDPTPRGSVVHRVFEQVVNGATKKHFVRSNPGYARATDRQPLVLGDWLVERRDFFDHRPSVERSAVHLTFGRLGPREEKKIIHDVPEVLALYDGRFN